MVATPSKGQTDPNYALQQQINDLKRQVTNLANKTLYSVNIGAGGITVNGGEITIEGSGGITIPVGGSILDSAGHVIIEADPVGGVAYPQIAVPMAPLYAVGPVSTGFNPLAFTGVTPTSSTTINTHAGFVPKIISPRFQWMGGFGVAGSLTSITVQTNLYQANGTASPPLLATLGTTTFGAIGPITVQGPYDITAFFNYTNCFFAYTITAIAGSSSGTVYCINYGAQMVGTV